MFVKNVHYGQHGLKNEARLIYTEKFRKFADVYGKYLRWLGVLMPVTLRVCARGSIGGSEADDSLE